MLCCHSVTEAVEPKRRSKKCKQHCKVFPALPWAWQQRVYCIRSYTGFSHILYFVWKCFWHGAFMCWHSRHECRLQNSKVYIWRSYTIKLTVNCSRLDLIFRQRSSLTECCFWSRLHNWFPGDCQMRPQLWRLLLAQFIDGTSVCVVCDFWISPHLLPRQPASSACPLNK